jgi:hypothetical protein
MQLMATTTRVYLPSRPPHSLRISSSQRLLHLSSTKISKQRLRCHPISVVYPSLPYLSITDHQKDPSSGEIKSIPLRHSHQMPTPPLASLMHRHLLIPPLPSHCPIQHQTRMAMMMTTTTVNSMDSFYLQLCLSLLMAADNSPRFWKQRRRRR